MHCSNVVQTMSWHWERQSEGSYSGCFNWHSLLHCAILRRKGGSLRVPFVDPGSAREAAVGEPSTSERVIFGPVAGTSPPHPTSTDKKRGTGHAREKKEGNARRTRDNVTQTFFVTFFGRRSGLCDQIRRGTQASCEGRLRQNNGHSQRGGCQTGKNNWIKRGATVRGHRASRGGSLQMRTEAETIRTEGEAKSDAEKSCKEMMPNHFSKRKL